MNIEELILDALYDPNVNDLICKSGTVELDGKSYSGSCYLHKSGRISVLLDPNKEKTLGDVLIKVAEEVRK